MPKINFYQTLASWLPLVLSPDIIKNVRVVKFKGKSPYSGKNPFMIFNPVRNSVWEILAMDISIIMIT